MDSTKLGSLEGLIRPDIHRSDLTVTPLATSVVIGWVSPRPVNSIVSVQLCVRSRFVSKFDPVFAVLTGINDTYD